MQDHTRRAEGIAEPVSIDAVRQALVQSLKKFAAIRRTN